MYDHHFSNLGRPLVPDNLCKDSAPRHLCSGEEDFNGFTISGHSGHLGKWTATILAIFHSPVQRRLHMRFEQYWSRGFRGEVV